MSGNASDDVRRMIRRETEIIEGLRRMRASARNKTVRSQCDSQISEASRNVAYLQARLDQLTLQRNQAADGTAGSKDDAVAPISATAGATTASTKDDGKVARLDLFRWDQHVKPHTMGPRIQLMLQQLEYKLSIEEQYEKGTRKLIHLYRQTGDRRSQNEASENLAESTAKMALLKRSKKRYSDMNLAAVIGDTDDNQLLMENVPTMRRPLTGVLHVFVKAVEEVDHTISWTDQVDMWITMKVENNSAAVARTRTSRTSTFNENFSIPVDNGNEIEFAVYDRPISSEQATPVALMWLRINDIAEAIRQKRVERELKETGWANAATVQRLASQTSSDPSLGATQPSTGQRSAVPSKSGPSAAGGPGAGNGASGNASRSGASTPSPVAGVVEGWFTLEPAGRIYLRLGFDKTGTNPRKRQRIYEGTNDLARLGRHNAIRKREETQQVHGHEFVHHQAYNIVRCSVCGDFSTSYIQCQECQLTCDRKCFSKIVTKCTALMSQDPDEELNHRIPHHFEPTTNMKATWCAQCGFILPLASRKNVRKCTECGIIVHASCAGYVPHLCGMSMETAAQVVNEINSTRIRQATKAAAATLSQQPPLHPSHPHQKNHGPAAHGHAHGHSHTKSSIESEVRQSPGGIPASTPQQARYGQLPYGSSGAGVPTGPPPRKTPIRRKQVPGSVPDAIAAIADPGSAINAAPSTSSLSHDAPLHSLDSLSNTTTSSSSRTAASSIAEKQPQASAPPASYNAAKQGPWLNPDRVSSGLPSASNALGAGTDIRTDGAWPKAPAPAQTASNAPATAPPPVPQAPSKTTVPDWQSTKNTAVSAPKGFDTSSKRNTLAYGSNTQTPSAQEAASALLAPSTRRRKKVGLDDFSFLAVLGKGNFGKVMLAESKHTGHLYAVKVLKKNFIIENREVESTRSEKRVFLIANRERHPFLINLFACFQTENRIYFVMDYVSGGDLMFHIQQKMFSAKRAQFYAAEVLLALKHFHENDVIYRDLKLDNILLSLDGHIKVADYGLCKENMGYGKTTGTFCGTPEFIAPEILLDQKYGRSVDWWALGVLMYQMLLGKSPFHGDDEDEVYDAILSDEPLYPIHMPRDSVSILQQLLTRDPSKRLGSGPSDAEEIMAHPYFSDINFDDLLELNVKPPYKPEIDSPTDVRYFESDFTSEMPALTPMNSVLTPDMQEEFRGFSYSLGDSI